MKGNQIPRIRIEPPRASTDGKGAAMLMEAYGLILDEWQELLLNCWLGKDAAGDYNVTSAGLSVPRQNGKNVCIEAREFYGLVINGERILHTAHQVRTAKKSFQRLAAMFTDKQHPEIIKLVKRIKYGIGEEAIELNNGGIIEFTSRSRQAARGYSGISLVVYDEAQELTDDQAEAIMATLSASATGTRQLLYVGTPPYLGCNGDVFKRFRAACIAQKGENLHSSWHEWSVAADTLDEINVDNKHLWYETNPALGYRLTEEFTKEELKTLSPDGFARERLGWWSSPAAAKQSEAAIDPVLWDGCASSEPKPDEKKTAYGVKFSADGSCVVLAGACIDAAGKARISIIEVQPLGRGISWLADWLNERYKKAACVVIDGKNGADVLIDKMRSTWIFKDSIIKPSAQIMTTAASLLLNELIEQTVTWYEKQDNLRESAVSSNKRSIAGGWGFGGPGSELIEACSLALWGVRTSKRNPLRVMRLG